MKTATNTGQLLEVTPETVHGWQQDNAVVLVDVREPFEHAQEWIEGDLLHPEGAFDAATLRDAVGAGARVCFYCRTGRRSAAIARQYGATGEAMCHMAGGIEAWKAAQLDVKRSATAPRFDVMQQTQMAMGTLVLTGVLLGWTVHPAFHGLAAFIGAGMVFAGASGSCGMAKLIARMPWNRSSGNCGASCSVS